MLYIKAPQFYMLGAYRLGDGKEFNYSNLSPTAKKYVCNSNQFLLALLAKDLGEVLELLRRHGYSGVSYHDLGLFLGLSANTMRVIEADHRGNTGRCLSECLTKWLDKADDVVKKGGPTISSLVSALRKSQENAVADGIKNEKCKCK